MRRFLLCLAVLGLSAIYADAQGIRDKAAQRSVMSQSKNTLPEKELHQNEFLQNDRAVISKSEDIVQPKCDTVFLYSNPIDSLAVAYYAKITKKNGWMVGVGKGLTYDEASHLSCYYKLSLKNYAGNWTRIEAYNGYGNLTTFHDIGTYLVNQFDDADSGVNQIWRERLLNVCKWEFIGDPSGQIVVQERALDFEDNVVYVYNPVKIGPNKYTGSYTDRWGMPIFMRTDSLGNDIGYANYVHIERDNRGFDVKLAYSDRYGSPQFNKDGSYMTYREYDDNGNQTKEASMNIVGNYMIDAWGNCGWEAKYENGNQVSSTYFDATWKPMRMPTDRTTNDNVYGYIYEYDEYGRNTIRYAVDDKGQPDVNQSGVHMVKTKYNDKGAYTYRGYFDLSGKLCSSGESGVAEEIFEFDSFGNSTLVEFKDKNGCYVVNPDYGFCKREMKTKDNDIYKQIEYITNPNTNQLIKSFEYTKDDYGHTRRVWYQENRVIVDSVDALGNNVVHAWYDLEGTPTEDYDGIHIHTNRVDKNTVIEEWRDADGEFVLNNGGYSKSITIIDNDRVTITNYQYYYNALKQSFTKQFTPNFEQISAQWDITPYGEHARVGWWDNLHYICEVDYNFHGDIRTMVARNEFGEASYITSLGNEGKVYHFMDTNNGSIRYYDEFGRLIPEDGMKEFMQELPKAICIEVTDTTIANQYGIKNGDIVISYGNWMVLDDLNTNIYEFYLAAILSADSEKHVTLLRHHPEISKSEIVKCILPEGKTSDLGFYPHMIYYTQKEKDRLINTCADHNVKLPNVDYNNEYTLLLAIPIKGAYLTTTLYHDPSYGVHDPGVVLSGNETYGKNTDRWDISQSIEEWQSMDMFKIRDSHLYISQDGNSVRHIHKKFKGYGGMRFIPIEVSKSIYDKFVDCYSGSSDKSTKKNDEYSSTYTDLICGEWKTSMSDIDIFLTINKDQTCNIKCELRHSEQIDESMIIDIIIELSNASTGKWGRVDSEITLFTSGAKFEFDLKDINIRGGYQLDKKTEKEVKKMFDSILSSELEDMNKSLAEMFVNISIDSVSEDTLTIDDLEFTRI